MFGTLVFCGPKTQDIIGVVEFQEEIRSADPTPRKKAYSRNFSQHNSSTMRTLYMKAHSTIQRGGPRVQSGVILCENLRVNNVVNGFCHKKR